MVNRLHSGYRHFPQTNKLFYVSLNHETSSLRHCCIAQFALCMSPRLSPVCTQTCSLHPASSLYTSGLCLCLLCSLSLLTYFVCFACLPVCLASFCLPVAVALSLLLKFIPHVGSRELNKKHTHARTQCSHSHTPTCTHNYVYSTSKPVFAANSQSMSKNTIMNWESEEGGEQNKGEHVRLPCAY